MGHATCSTSTWANARFKFDSHSSVCSCLIRLHLTSPCSPLQSPTHCQSLMALRAFTVFVDEAPQIAPKHGATSTLTPYTTTSPTTDSGKENLNPVTGEQPSGGRIKERKASASVLATKHYTPPVPAKKQVHDKVKATTSNVVSANSSRKRSVLGSSEAITSAKKPRRPSVQSQVAGSSRAVCKVQSLPPVDEEPENQAPTVERVKEVRSSIEASRPKVFASRHSNRRAPSVKSSIIVISSKKPGTSSSSAVVGPVPPENINSTDEVSDVPQSKLHYWYITRWIPQARSTMKRLKRRSPSRRALLRIPTSQPARMSPSLRDSLRPSANSSTLPLPLLPHRPRLSASPPLARGSAVTMNDSVIWGSTSTASTTAHAPSRTRTTPSIFCTFTSSELELS